MFEKKNLKLILTNSSKVSYVLPFKDIIFFTKYNLIQLINLNVIYH